MISMIVFQKWNNAGLHPNLQLPDRNEFIPTDFELMKREETVSGLSSTNSLSGIRINISYYIYHIKFTIH